MPIYKEEYRRHEARQPLHQVRFWPITREALPRLFGNQEGDRYRHNEGYQFLAKSLLAARRGEEAMPGIDGGAQQPFHGVR